MGSELNHNSSKHRVAQIKEVVVLDLEPKLELESLEVFECDPNTGSYVLVSKSDQTERSTSKDLGSE